MPRLQLNLALLLKSPSKIVVLFAALPSHVLLKSAAKERERWSVFTRNIEGLMLVVHLFFAVSLIANAGDGVVRQSIYR